MRKVLLYIHFRNTLYFANRAQWFEAALETNLALRLEPDLERLKALDAWLSERLTATHPAL
jgi:hypothetical protein